MDADVTWMARAIELAERGRYSVSPNPMVGAVLVRDGRRIAEGFHERAGAPHAEIEALRSCPDAAGSTLFVNLEPCNHQGRTPPCTRALVDAGIVRVVSAVEDPNPEVSGRGLEALRAAGIEVVTGILREQAARLNEKFLHFAVTGRPFVLLKAALTLDGKLATAGGQSRWITSPEARERSLALREEYDAILVGGGTVIADDPRLTRRLGWNVAVVPWKRIVIEGRRRIPSHSVVLTDGLPTLLVTRDRGRSATEGGPALLHYDGDSIELGALLEELGRQGIPSVIVEGGSRLLTSMIEQSLWQKMILFVAPVLVGGRAAPAIFDSEAMAELTRAPRFRFDEVDRAGPDLAITVYPA